MKFYYFRVMPRNYKRKLGSRTYRDYSQTLLDEVIQKVADGTLTLRQASEDIKFPIALYLINIAANMVKNQELKHFFLKLRNKIYLDRLRNVPSGDTLFILWIYVF